MNSCDILLRYLDEYVDYYEALVGVAKKEDPNNIEHINFYYGFINALHNMRYYLIDLKENHNDC